MDRTLLVLAVSFSLLAGAPVVSVMANEETDSQEAQQAASEINTEADTDAGREAVAGRLQNEFHVEESVINDLRSAKMGYGEIGIALSLAEQMPGGITNENIQKVMDLRQADTKSGWGNVAKQLNLNLGKVVSQTKKIANERQATQNPDTNKRTPGEEASHPKFESPASGGKPAGMPNKPMHTPGGGVGRGKK